MNPFSGVGLGGATKYAMSQPAFVPERHEIWYSDGVSGFYALRVDPSVWPGNNAPGARPQSTHAVTTATSSSLSPTADAGASSSRRSTSTAAA